jgi:hypothetical protein
MTAEDESEMAMAMRRAGITIPPGREAGIRETWRELQTMRPLLRNGRTAAAEPAGIYALDTITRDPA